MEPSAERAMKAVQQFLLDTLPSCRQIARESNVQFTDLQILHLVHLQCAPTTATALCSLSGLPSSTMSRTLDRLEEGGFITRRHHPQDRRLRLISTVPDRVESIIEHFAPARKKLEAEMSVCSESMLDRICEFIGGVAAIQLLLARPGTVISEIEESIR